MPHCMTMVLLQHTPAENDQSKNELQESHLMYLQSSPSWVSRSAWTTSGGWGQTGTRSACSRPRPRTMTTSQR